VSSFILALLLASSSASALSYDWSNGVDGLVTRCFSTKRIEANCEDLTEQGQGRQRIEELQIHATDYMGEKFFYSYEKGISGEVCSEHLRGIKRLKKGIKEACITGGPEWRVSGDAETNAKWRAFESLKGRIVW
jgi:hypothetical protein